MPNLQGDAGPARPSITTAAGAGHGYIHCLDGVRAASILFVLAAHTLPLGPGVWLLNAASGRVGMALFFCLSGYLITSILYRDPRILPFLVKRSLRIVPALFLYLTVLLVFFDLPLRSYLLNLLFVSNYQVDALSEGPVSHLWSLCVEMHFYIATAVAVGLAGRKALWLVFPAALVVTGLRIDAGVVSNINTHLRVDEILVGGWLALVSMHHGDRIRAWLRPARVAAPLLALIATLFLISSHDNGGWLVYARPYLAMALVGGIMHCDLRGLLAVLEGRVARYIAETSYALYIWHPLMVFGWMNTGSTAERYLLKRPVSWTLTLVAAHLSTYVWERRWQRFARRLLGGGGTRG